MMITRHYVIRAHTLSSPTLSPSTGGDANPRLSLSPLMSLASILFSRRSPLSIAPLCHPMDASTPKRNIHAPQNRSYRRPRGGKLLSSTTTLPKQDESSIAGSSRSVPCVNTIHRTPLPIAKTSHILSSRPSSPTGLSTTCFSDFVCRKRLDKSLFVNIPFEFCTEVQAATMDAILDGSDVMARAKTGTGKTLAFLLPTIQRHLLEKGSTEKGISILVLSPTRELAIQIEKEAKKIIGRNQWTSQIVVGGTNINTEIRNMQMRCDLLVATPGRLLDHLQNHNLAPRLQGLRCLVLDEADRLLDQGFRVELEKIARYIPINSNRPRQTLLFSATISPQVQRVAYIYMSPEHRFISTVKETDESTHAHVKQEYTIIDVEWHLPLLAKLLVDMVQTNPKAKVICFFNTAMATALAASLFRRLDLPLPVFEIHSRLSQAARTRATNEFTAVRSGVLFSSDVTARGIDIPGITAVIQIGLPANAEQYVHRLGRTARAGNDGTGFLILAPWEQRFLANKTMVSIPIQESDIKEEDVASSLQPWKDTIDRVMASLEEKPRCSAYQAMLGYYASNLKVMSLSGSSLLLIMNQYAKTTLRWRLEIEGKDGLPPVKRKVAGKLPLPKHLTQQLNLVETLPFGD